MRHNDTKNTERLLLLKIAEKQPVIDDWKRQQQRKRDDAAEDDYRRANKELRDQ